VQAERHLAYNPEEATSKSEEGKVHAYKRVQRGENGDFIRIRFTSRGARLIKRSRSINQIHNR